MTRWRRRLVVMGTLLCLFLAVAYHFSSLFLPVSRDRRVERVEIPAGASTGQIASLLSRHRLIRSPTAFVLSTRVLGEAQNLKAGEYELDARLGLFHMIEKLTRGDAISHWVTIPEGYTVDKIAQRLQERRLADARYFEEYCQENPGQFLDVESPRSSLEGYLLPDSYKFKDGVTEQQIIKAMTANFRKKVLQELAEDIRKSGRPVDEVVTIASLIEREARVPQDRDKISAVIRNRLKKKMRLQIDATVLYALGSHKERILFSDLKVDHPYNTYRHAGLPPGPICNPGLECIKAALHPADVPYLYYVAKSDGSHTFSTTYGEHQKNGGS